MNRCRIVKIAVILSLTCTGLLSANAERTKLSILAHAKEVKSISQRLPKNYLYIQQRLQVVSAEKALKRDITSLSSSIVALQEKTKNREQETINIVEFMQFTLDELKATLKKKFDAKSGGLVLNYSESFLEGANLVTRNTLGSAKNKKQDMLEVTEEMRYLLDRAAKYYIAFRAGYTHNANVEETKRAVGKFTLLIERVKNHEYTSAATKEAVKKLSRYWPATRNFFLGIKRGKLPSLVFISTKHMEMAIDLLIRHHEKEQ